MLEKLRLCWWQRAYKKIWENFCFKDGITFSTESEASASALVSFVVSNINQENNGVVLDIGCGNGILSERVFKNCKLLIQTDFFFKALKLIDRNKSPEKKFILQSAAEALPFKEGVFDYIFVYSLLHNSGSVENAKQWVKGMLFLLKDGGRLYIGDVPLRKKIAKELKRRIKNIRTLNHLKYYFAEFMQVSFGLDDFLDIEGIGQIQIFFQPENLKFSRWRVDIEIKK